jgi:hypothetical protein
LPGTARGMRLRRMQEMEWGPLFVFDNALDSDDIGTILTLQKAGKIDAKGSSTGTRNHETPHSGIEMSPQIFNQSGLHAKLQAEIENRYCCTNLTTKRIYITESRYGENTLIHSDWWADKKKGDLGITAIVFLNPVWKREWGGELMFFDKKREAMHCVAPKPGRLTLFPSSTLHRGGVPSRLFYDTRRALVVMFAVKASKEITPKRKR